MHYVYLIRCNDGKVYIGCSRDLRKRFKAHQNGKVNFTSSRRPLELVIYISFRDEYKARAFEKYLKSGSGKTFAQKRFL